MRFSTRSALIAFTIFTVLVAMVCIVGRLPTYLREDLFWFFGSVGAISGIACVGAGVGWLSAQKSWLVPTNLWPGLVLSAANWGFFAVVRFTLFLTVQWDESQQKNGGLEAMESLASIYFFEALAIVCQLVIVVLSIRRDSKWRILGGAVMAIVWVSIITVELIVCAYCGIRLGGLS